MPEGLDSLTTGRHLESAVHTEVVVEPELDSFGKRQEPNGNVKLS